MWDLSSNPNSILGSLEELCGIYLDSYLIFIHKRPLKHNPKSKHKFLQLYNLTIQIHTQDHIHQDITIGRHNVNITRNKIQTTPLILPSGDPRLRQGYMWLTRQILFVRSESRYVLINGDCETDMCRLRYWRDYRLSIDWLLMRT